MPDLGGEWPPYLHGMGEHLKAIGAIVTTWNHIEISYQCFMQLVFDKNMDEGIHANELLSIDQRAKLIRGQLYRKVNADEAECVEYFLKCASICKDNRNAIAHAHYNPTTIDGFLMGSKGASKDRTKLNQFYFSIAGLQEMADASFLVHHFGMEIWSSIELRRTKETLPNDPFWASQPLSLPQKPSQPRSWDQIREAPKPPPTQPQSSEGSA